MKSIQAKHDSYTSLCDLDLWPFGFQQAESRVLAKIKLCIKFDDRSC